jgi:restriction system protein
VRVWQSSGVVDAVLANYERLGDDIRSQLPLKRMWMLDDTGALTRGRCLGDERT